MTTTPVLALPDLASGQAIPETTVNENTRWLEFFAAGGAIEDRDDTAPPGSPADGEAYLVDATATGLWTGHDGDIALYISTAWAFKEPKEGMCLYVKDEDLRIVYDGAAWQNASSSGGGTYTDEMARDAIGAALVSGGTVNIAVSDGSDTITVSSGAVSTQSGTSYTAVLGDANTYIRFTNGSAVSFTIPPNSSVAFPVGTIIEVEQAGAGALSFVAGSGVTVNSRSSDLTLAGQYAVAFAKKVATDTWTVNGDL